MVATGITATLFYVIATLVVQYTVVQPSFEELERAQGASELARVALVFSGEEERVRAICESWAARPPESLPFDGAWCARHHLNLAIWVTNQGQVLRRVTCLEETAAPISLPDVPELVWPRNHPLWPLFEKPEPRLGYLLTGTGIFLVAVQPVDGGVIMAGRLVLRSYVKSLRGQGTAEAYFGVCDVRTTGPPARPGEYRYSTAGDGALKTALDKPDLLGQPAFELGVRLPRTITSRGNAAVRMSALGAVGVGLVAMLFLTVVLRRAVTTPMGQLLEHVSTIRGSNDLALVDVGERNDEFGILAAEFNRMVTRLHNDACQRERMTEQLEESRRLAELGELGASVAHEIRNPIAGIGGALQVIRDGLPAADPRREVIGEALAQASRVENTVRQLLEFAKPWNPSKQEADLRAFVAETGEAFLRRAMMETYTLEVEAGDPIMAAFDPVFLEQVLENVLCNAAHAMPEGGKIHVVFEESQETAWVRVRDEGSGVTPETLPHAFDPFFTTKTQGTGLGLAICRRILEAHGGTISIGNTGQGAEVAFTLPRKEEACPPAS